MLESRLLVVRCCVRLLLFGAAVTYSALAPALGLGDITVHSALNQPLRADIALVDAGGLEEGELSVSLATADEFSRAGVERVVFLNDLKFTPVLKSNRSFIRVSSNKAVNEPFLNFLVQLNQPNGQLLREYTVLIDPPGSPEIVPATDEPTATPSPSAFPSVQPAAAPTPARKEPPKPAAGQANEPLAEQPAASELQTQQLQATVDELKAKLQAQDEQIAADKKQVSELQARLTEVQQSVAKPVKPAVAAPMVVEEAESRWPVILGVFILVGLVVLGWFVIRRRQVSDDAPESSTRQEPMMERAVEPPMPPSAIPANPEETPTGDVLEAVDIYLTYGRFAEAAGLLREAMVKEPQRTDLAEQLLDVLGKQGDLAAYEAQETSLRNGGFDAQKLHEIRTRHPKLSASTPVTVAALAIAPADEFQLNLDDLSMDTSWDLTNPFESPPSSEPPLSEAEIVWVAEPDTQPLDNAFLAEFSEPLQLLQLEPLNLKPAQPSNVGKLEQAQTCIDDGDLDGSKLPRHGC
ncbi:MULTISPECIES: type IV pilus assembly protein FimV [unclassified Pseudomonas]|uniref:Peptidoglycan-binding protein LysM n=1 Tax=Pseudomonas sp. MYb327 TaxID=2745230 RepID=A0AAU8E4K6_9PSED